MSSPGQDRNQFLVLRARLFREAARFGHGDWRIADDAVDLALDRVANVLPGPSSRHPSAWLPYAVRVYQNLVRSSSSSVALRRIKTVSLTAEHSSSPPPSLTGAGGARSTGTARASTSLAATRPRRSSVAPSLARSGSMASRHETRTDLDGQLRVSPMCPDTGVTHVPGLDQREFRGDPSPPPSLNGAEQHRSAFHPS